MKLVINQSQLHMSSTCDKNSDKMCDRRQKEHSPNHHQIAAFFDLSQICNIAPISVGLQFKSKSNITHLKQHFFFSFFSFLVLFKKSQHTHPKKKKVFLDHQIKWILRVLFSQYIVEIKINVI